MKDTYIQSIHVNKLFHLHDFDIRIGDEGQAKKHLIITGLNGTGKTLLLNAIADRLENIATDKALRFIFHETSCRLPTGSLTRQQTPRRGRTRPFGSHTRFQVFCHKKQPQSLEYLLRLL